MSESASEKSVDIQHDSSVTSVAKSGSLVVPLFATLKPALRVVEGAQSTLTSFLFHQSYEREPSPKLTS